MMMQLARHCEDAEKIQPPAIQCSVSHRRSHWLVLVLTPARAQIAPAAVFCELYWILIGLVVAKFSKSLILLVSFSALNQMTLAKSTRDRSVIGRGVENRIFSIQEGCVKELGQSGRATRVAT
jgi:hypothetical protein